MRILEIKKDFNDSMAAMTKDLWCAACCAAR